MHKIAVTATRNGLTEKQKAAALQYLRKSCCHWGAIEVHHGDCIGGDKDVADIAFSLMERDCEIRIVKHPCNASAELAANHPHFHEVRAVTSPLHRNRTMVWECAELIAFPQQDEEPVHAKRAGGTWYTIRFSRHQKKPRRVFWPGGDVTIERTSY